MKEVNVGRRTLNVERRERRRRGEATVVAVESRKSKVMYQSLVRLVKWGGGLPLRRGGRGGEKKTQDDKTQEAREEGWRAVRWGRGI